MKRHERRPGTVLRALKVRAQTNTRFRRGVYILPSMFTMGSMFCGYACIVYAMRGDYETAAPFIGISIVLDMLDGRIARLTGTTSAFGLEFDSLADVIAFGMAPAILTLAWGMGPLGRLGWAAGFLYVAAAAMRLARFNIQTPSLDKRYFVGMPSPAAAAVPAATVYLYPYGLHDYREALAALALVVVPAFLMVSTIRFWSFKSVDLGWRRSYRNLILIAIMIVAITTHPQLVLLAMAYVYLASGPAAYLWSRLNRRRGPEGDSANPVDADDQGSSLSDRPHTAERR